jgi:hypothetical protein
MNFSKGKERLMKKILLMILFFVISLSLAGVAMAANHPNLIGTWSGVVNFVGWNNSVQFYGVDFVFPFEIQDQDPATGNFYGLRSGSYPITGNVSTNKIVTIVEYGDVGEYRILTGKVSGKKMTGTMQHFLPGQVDTGTFTFYKE